MFEEGYEVIYSMRRRYLVPLGAVAGVVVLFAAISLTGQTPAASKSAKAKATGKSKAAKSTAAAKGLPRTPWGDPDLQGTWFVMYDIPLERSAANAGKEFLTDAEIAASDAKKGLDPGRNARSAGAQDVSGAYNAVFNSVLRTGKRTSMIIDPPDGKIPPLVPGAQAFGRGQFGPGRLATQAARDEAEPQSWESRPARTTTRRPPRNRPDVSAFRCPSSR